MKPAVKHNTTIICQQINTYIYVFHKQFFSIVLLNGIITLLLSFSSRYLIILSIFSNKDYALCMVSLSNYYVKIPSQTIVFSAQQGKMGK